jgi:hypothetical protein
VLLISLSQYELLRPEKDTEGRLWTTTEVLC